MNFSATLCPVSEFSANQAPELRGLDTREQFSATLHLTTQHFVEQGGRAEDAAYFLIAAARSVLDQQAVFSADTAIARECMRAALEHL